MSLRLRLLTKADSASLSNLLLSASVDYCKYFRPFSFDVTQINQNLSHAVKDKYFGLEIHFSGSHSRLVGFCMLRGIDEGYPDPMFGVFVSEEFRNKGFGKLCLLYCEVYCKINSYTRLLLKVHPGNKAALSAYTSLGFSPLNSSIIESQIIMVKNLRSSND